MPKPSSALFAMLLAKYSVMSCLSPELNKGKNESDMFSLDNTRPDTVKSKKLVKVFNLISLL